MSYSAILILVMSLITILLRSLPFLLFTNEEKTPSFIVYLGSVLPQAAMGMLVIYCLRNVQITAASSWIPECISVITVILLQMFKRNALLSILGGTILYMVIVQLFL